VHIKKILISIAYVFLIILETSPLIYLEVVMFITYRTSCLLLLRETRYNALLHQSGSLLSMSLSKMVIKGAQA